MPGLRIQFHDHVFDRRSRGKRHAGCMRALPLHSLVIPRRVDVSLEQLMLEVGPRPELMLLVRLLAAGGLGAMLGWERESAHKPAGLRTHILVGIASALFTVLAELAVADYPGHPGGLRADPIRVIQAIAIGIGFLGSGVIFVSKSGESVRGLTTAASIWATAAIGIACGFGYYVLALGATLLLLLVLRGGAKFEKDENDK